MNLPTRSKVVRFHQFGLPFEVAKVEDELTPLPQAGELVIEMLASPINPADLNFIEGSYGVKAVLPAVPGFEGSGKVIAVGPNVTRFKIGDNVKPPDGTGTWRQLVCARQESCIKLPSDIPAEQLAMIYVNPPTAWRMLHDFVPLKKGDWIIQNAANSAVGRCVIQIAKAKGWHTINIVRRSELIDELKALGGDVVVLESEKLKQNVMNAIQEPIMLGLNAVGGNSAIWLADCLEKGGTVVTYGGMSKEPFKIPTRFFIFKDLRFVGFWMSHWYKQRPVADREAMLREVGELMRAKKLSIKIDKTFSLDDITPAIQHALQPNRQGKTLLNIKK
ncbi:MAG: MDR family NADPH-dependent oxidoreductase [Verrucomicrobiota bacterium]